MATKDLSDYFAAGGTPEALRELIKSAKVLKSASGHLDGNGHLNTEAFYQPVSGPVLVRIADVQREEVEWRWQDRIPRGRLVMIDGDPGVGKSFLTLAIATAETLGTPLPGDLSHFEPRNVLILTAEDGLGDTVRPRLEDMGADLQRVMAMTAVRDFDGKERFPNLADDLQQIEASLAGGEFGLLIIDPINAYLGGIDSHKDAEIRSVLAPLAQLAERFHLAVLVVRRLTKGGRDRAIYRGVGSIGYTAAARSVLLVGRNPDNERQVVVCCIKHNLAPDSSAIAYEVFEGRFTWLGEVDVTPEQLLAPDAKAEVSSKHAAVEFLHELLADGPVAQKQVEAEAKAKGIARRTLQRAKDELYVRSRGKGEIGKKGQGAWFWSLPDESSGESSDASVIDESDGLRVPDGYLGEIGNLDRADGEPGDPDEVTTEEVF